MPIDQATFTQEVQDIGPILTAAATTKAALDQAVTADQGAVDAANQARDTAHATAQADIDTKKDAADSANQSQIDAVTKLVKDAADFLAGITPPVPSP